MTFRGRTGVSVQWHFAAEPACPSNDVPQQNRPWNSRSCSSGFRTSTDRRTGFFFFFASTSRSWNSRSCQSGFKISTDKRTGFFFFRQSVEVLKFEVLSVGFQDLDRQTDIFFFFLPPFSGELPKVNTRVFFFPPFSGGLPWVNTRVFYLFNLFNIFFPPFSGGLP